MTAPILRILTHDVRYEEDVVLARQRARHIAAEIGFDLLEQTRIGTAVSEMARNGYRYARGSRVAFEVSASVPQELVITVIDDGPGIADLDLVLSGRYVSTTGMGMGIIGARRLMDDLRLETGPEGTVVTMRKRLPAHRLVTPREVAAIGEQIRREAIGTPLEELQSQNQELMRAVAEIQQRQAEIERLNDELKETNRGVLALNAELEDKAESLRSASETKSRFLSHVSHEFRTPLNSIRSLAKILASRLDGPLTEEQEKQVGFILRSAETLADMVNDLLDLAKIEAGKTEVQAAQFTLQELFGAMRGMFRPLLAHSPVELVLRVQPDLPPLYTDEGKLSQILRNFISNAVKFTEQGRIEISGAVTSEDLVRISVSDTGIGIAPEHRHRVFEEFAQIPNPLQKTAKGTGLGLSLSFQLAKLLGGTIELESVPGEGSTFTVVIPRVAPSATPPLSEVTYEPDPDEAGRPRVLIVDDLDADRYALRALLPRGCDVFEAHNGAEALAAVAAARPAIVFLDLGMPDIDGVEVLRRLAADGLLARTSVVIHTSQPLSPADVERLRALGAVGVMPKAYGDLDVVRREIAGLIDEAANRNG